LEKAVSELNVAVDLKPDYAEAYYNLAVSYAGMDKLKLAREFADKAKELDYPIEEDFLESIKE
jgi:tetratricopeptide (TPR) repeat protein